MKMRKMLAILMAALSIVWTISANAAGTIGFSLSQQFDTHGHVLNGCLLYTIQAGTTSTPQNAFKDTALTLPHTNPIECDAFGRLPQFFLADGQIKIRLTDRNNVDQFNADNILVVGPSAGGGGGGSVDPTTVLTTGDFKMQYGTGPITGFVRCNGRTIGSATSGASERANADTNSLFSFLWVVDPNLTVTPSGRGANAGADFASNKQITLPDCRGRTLAGLDDMGNAAAGRLTATFFGTSATVLGAAGGSQSITLLLANLPPYTPSGTVSFSQTDTNNQLGLLKTSPGGNVQFGGTGTGGATTPISGSNFSTSFSGNAQGGTSTPHSTVGPRILTTIYIKL
jgi:hypothetical protein